MKKTERLLLLMANMLFLSFLFYSCTPDEPEPTDPLNSEAIEEARHRGKGMEFYALTHNNKVIKYSLHNSMREVSGVAITGLMPNESIIAIDFRPATGQLFGVSNQSRLYVINLDKGRAAQIGTQPFSPAIDGTEVGFDFNPTVDRIRLVTNKGQNLRLNPETGAVAAVDGNLNPGSPAVVAVAYTNSMAGATATTLYDIDVKKDKLFIQNPPNDGGLVEVGRLNVQADGEGGFDISPDNSLAIAALYSRGGGAPNQKSKTNGNKFTFYSIDLKTGKAKNLGKSDRNIIGIAIPTNPVAYAVDARNNMMIFDPYNARTVITKPVMGLQPGERVLGIDMRPATAQLYALGSSNRIYAVNLATAEFTAVGGPFTPALSGDYFGFDFNPTVDRIRVVSNTGQNLRLNPNDGMVAAVDGNLNPGPPMVDASAYTKNYSGATTTQLYNIDYKENALYLQNPPNDGTQVMVGRLNVKVDARNGFDIGGTSGKAVALLHTGGHTGIYMINLGNGRASMVSSLKGSPQSFALGLGF